MRASWNTTTLDRRVRMNLRAAASLARAWPEKGTAFFSFAFVTFLAADGGGYWPTAWGWSALALAFPAFLTALFLWLLLSSVWASSATNPILESERALVYVAGASAALIIVRPSSSSAFLGGKCISRPH